MAHKISPQRYRNWYAKLLRLYAKPYRERFGAEMEQTFNDVLCDRAEEGRRLRGCALWMCAETSVGIVRENFSFILMQYRNIVRIVLVVAALLTVPLVAMQFTDEVTWTGFDFVVAGGLLLGTGLTYELLARRVRASAYRFAVGIGVGTALFLVWINLAVGIIGSEDNPANAMYLGVVAVEFIGALLARFRPRGMARALFATAFAHAVVAVFAVLFFQQDFTVMLDGFFVGLWVVSAVLFSRAHLADSKGNPAFMLYR